MLLDRNQQWAFFESLGENTVRERIALQAFNEQRTRLAEEWLRQKDQERLESAAREQAASQSEANSIARSAKEAAERAAEAAERAATAAEAQALAAERQARAAEKANKRATIALIIATISAAITAFDIFKKW